MVTVAILEVTQLTKSFGDTKVLKGIDFSMERGEILSVIGSSGSGKTTLLRCLTSLETADSGRIVVDGDLVFDGKTELSRAQKRKNQLKMGLVFQKRVRIGKQISVKFWNKSIRKQNN